MCCFPTCFGYQDVVNSYVLGPNFDLKTLRKDNAKRFFDMNRADSTSSVAALEDNFEFVLQLAVTYAPDGFFPPHSVFKVSLACLPGIHRIRTRACIYASCMFR